MKKTMAFLMVTGAILYAADPAAMTVGKMYDSQIKSAEEEIVSLAEAMPESKFDFKPSNGDFAKVRTFAEQIKHVATVNYMVSAVVLNEKAPRDLGTGENGPDDIKGKAAVVTYLKDSFAYAHKAALTLTDKNQLDMVTPPWGNQKVPRASMANVAISHPFDHYGQLVIYARMNGVVPPASR